MTVEFPIYSALISHLFKTFFCSLRIIVSTIDRRFGFLLLICIISVKLVAQITPPSNLRLTTANGLPNNSVTGIMQDRAGFVWIATDDGLARYDGRAVKVFRHRTGDSVSLADNRIRELLPTSDGTFVLATESGTVQRFDPITEQFATLLDRQFLDRNKALVNHIQLSADGRHIWGLLPNVRLIDYDIQRQTLRVYGLPALLGNVDRMDDFVLTSNGQLYGECRIGLFHFDTKTGRHRLIRYPFTKAPGNYWPIDYHQITQTPNGEIAVFVNQHIALYNPVQERFRTIPIPDPLQQRDIWYHIKTLSDNRLYVGYADRLYRLDANDRLVRIPLPEPITTQTASWLLDRSGVLWVGGRLTGLNRIYLHRLPFGFVPKRKSFSEDLLEQELGVSLPNNYVIWDIDHWPRYALGPNNRGYLIDPEYVYRHTPGSTVLTGLENLRTIDGEWCCNLCLKVSREGKIWLYRNNWGLVASEPDGRNNIFYPNSQLPLIDKTPGHDAADIQPLNGSVWVGSQYGMGLFRYDIARQRYDAPLLKGNKSAGSTSFSNINCLSADPIDSTVLWIGTAGEGLWRLNTRTMVFRRFSESEGFPNGTVVSLETDGQGMLWCATNTGLVRVNSRTMAWRHFTATDGLAESSFLQTSSARLPDGRLVFGTPNGRVIFNPASIRDDSFDPPIVLTSLLVNNKPMEANRPASTYTLTAPINALSELRLDHTQNFLTIAFAGLDYGKAERLTYRYQLTEVDDDWVNVGTQNTANYTQLKPGRYLFRVNSTTADGRWSRQVKQLSIVITPPFWATWWAYSLYVLVFIGGVLGFIRFRIRQIRQQQGLELKRREAEQLRALDEMKTRFFSNITHEFRTPLTLILSPTEKLLQQPADLTTTRRVVASVHENARQLLRLINQLLDLLKLEDGSMRVSLVRGDAMAFVQRLVENLQPLAVSRGLTLEIIAPVSEGVAVGREWIFDADKWEKILTNLLANALKFTPSGGQVVLALTPQTTDQVVLQLTDTGTGIAARHIPYIFDRFYQVDSSQTRAYEGTGIGLALVKELVDLLGGTITVQSRTEAPTGTTFTLTLPLQPATGHSDAPKLVLPGSDAIAFRPPLSGNRTINRKLAVADDAPLVLIVDDNEELRSFIAGNLMNRYRVRTAADGEEGWELCLEELPDVVITDVMMPRLDGYQLTHRIKSTPATNHIAVIMLTARVAYESRIAGLEQGADDYLTKPFHSDELSLRLDNMLTQRANLRAYQHRQLSLPPAGDVPVVDAFVALLHEVIEARLSDITLDVGELAEAVSMSRRTLNRKLAVTTNLSAVEFIRNYRLQRAAQLLKAGRPVAEIAYNVGFESPAYFAKVFKLMYQQTPSEFQNQQRATGNS